MTRTSNIFNVLKRGHIAAIAAICLFASCTTDVTYHHYEHIAHEGWDKRDTIRFTVDTIRQAGKYMTTLCMRSTAEYPYRNISMRVFEEVRPSSKLFIHRMDFNIVNENGTQTGNGINYFTNEIPIGTLELHPGDTLMIKVGHNMRNETLHGIEDLGIKVTAQ